MTPSRKPQRRSGCGLIALKWLLGDGTGAKRGSVSLLEDLKAFLACEVECSVFEGQVAPAIDRFITMKKIK